jgi:hypothetical protein
MCVALVNLSWVTRRQVITCEENVCSGWAGASHLGRELLTLSTVPWV